MPITAITIENFKGIRRPIRIELKPITLLFGPNSAGKSTIVQALHYAREIFERQNVNPDRTLTGGDAIDLGGFKNMVYNQDENLPIKIRFDLDLQNEDLPAYVRADNGKHTEEREELLKAAWLASGRAKSAWVQVDVEWSKFEEKPFVAQYEVGLNGEILGRINATPDLKKVYISLLNFHNPALYDEDIISEGDPVSTNYFLEGQPTPIPNWGRSLEIANLFPKGLSDEEFGIEHHTIEYGLTTFQPGLVGTGELIRDDLRKLCYIGPLREVPKRNHKPAISPDDARWASGIAAYDTLLFARESFIDQVNEWLTQEGRLNSGYSVEVKKYWELETTSPFALAVLQGRILDEETGFKDTLLSLPIKQRLLIRNLNRKLELEPQDIGVGISQVLPVIVAALHRKSGMVAIEQPELHIHPAFQVALGDIFIEQVRKRVDLKFILETHSEHLMLRFLRRIREAGEQDAPPDRVLHPGELAVYFIEQGEEGISCMPIRVDEDGDFVDRWPYGFFAERAQELF